jgi:hypothetical protein
LAVPYAPALAELLEPADVLTEYAVSMRYPDEWRDIEPEEMLEVVAVAKRFASVLLPRLE